MIFAEIAIGLLLIFVHAEVQGQRPGYPVNTLAVVGNDAELFCRYHASSCAQIKWQKRSTNGHVAVNISDGSTVYNQNKYRLDVSVMCELIIKNIQLADSGTYICTIAGSTRGLADLIVLQNKPSCSSSCKPNQTVEGETVQFKCGLTHGGVGIRTSLSWWNNQTTLEIAGVPPERTSNSNRTVNRDFSGKALAPQVDSLICLARFYVEETNGKNSKVPEIRCLTETCKISSVRRGIELPDNSVAVVGDNGKFSCVHYENSCSQIRWLKSSAIGQVANNSISNGSQVYNDRKYRLNILYLCELIVLGIQSSDSGTYICNIDETTSRSADLIVLKAKPSCSTSCESNTTAEDDNVDFKCGLTHDGVGIRASLSWWTNWVEITAIPPGRTSNSNRTVNRDFVGKALAPKVDSLICLARFYVEQTQGKSSKVPSIQCLTETCEILYWVRNVVTWPLLFASPDEEITCKAEGNPDPSFEWEWKEVEAAEDDEWTTVPDETEETITAFLNNGTSIKLRCVAKNEINGKEQTARSLAVIVSEGGATTRTGIIVGVVVAVVILAIVAGVVYKFCFDD